MPCRVWQGRAYPILAAHRSAEAKGPRSRVPGPLAGAGGGKTGGWNTARLCCAELLPPPRRARAHGAQGPAGVGA